MSRCRYVPHRPLYERVESEERLIEQFKVSRTTVRMAIQNLIERGFVEVRRGKGTFVTQPKITQELTELTGFVEDMQTLGRHATARLLDKRIVAADEAVAHHLALAPGTLVVRLRRVRLADGVAVSFDETYLPRDIGEKVTGNDLEAEPVFSLLENSMIRLWSKLNTSWKRPRPTLMRPGHSKCRPAVPSS
jgi:GntR family transcriptional regulator